MKPFSKPTNPDKPLGGRYKIIGELGAGGFGQTFLAQDLHLPDHPRCVVKQLKPQASDSETLQTARRLFDIEARVLYKLGNHDQIPRLLAHFEENQEFYLAQELVDGEPLTEEIKEGQRWSETQVIAFLLDLLQVLAFVHQQSVIHRDLKPSNLMRRRQDDRIVLIDFGAVKQVSTQIINPQTGQTKTISIGTQGYTPKEQLGGNPRFSSDIYAAGIIGIQALTGIHPRHLPEDPYTGEISWHDHTPQVSAELAEYLDCMVRYDFRTRFPTALEALSALRNLSTSNTQYGLMTQPLSENSGTLPMQQWQFPPSATASTGSGLGQAPTNNWTPTNPSAQSQATGSTQSGSREATTPSSGSGSPVTNTGATVNVAQFQPHEHSSTNTVPTVVTTGGGKKKLVIVWSSLAVLLAAGGTFLVTKTFLARQFANQTRAPSQVSVSSPSGSPAQQSESPTVASNPSVSPTETPNATPVSPTVASSPIVSNPSVSPNATPTTTPALPLPSSPASTQVSPVPAASPPPTKSAPAWVPPAAKPAPPVAAPQAADLVKQGDRAREGGQYQKAIELYNQAIALNPKVPEAHWGRCYSLNSVQQPDDALSACNQALAINPNYPEALWSKGSALDQKQNPIEALKNYQKATTLKPDFAEAWNNQGVALLKLKRPTDALAALDRATKLKPNFANAWANRGAALWQLGRLEEAIASMEKAIQLNPNDQDIINLRQQIMEQLRR